MLIAKLFTNIKAVKNFEVIFLEEEIVKMKTKIFLILTKQKTAFDRH